MKCSASLLGEDSRYTPTPAQRGLIERPEEVLHPGGLGVPSRVGRRGGGRRSIKRERGVEFLVAERPRLLLDDQGLPRPWGQGGLFPLSRTRADNRAYGVMVPPVPLRLRGLYRYCASTTSRSANAAKYNAITRLTLTVHLIGYIRMPI